MGQTEIRAEGGLCDFSNGTDKMTALELKEPINAPYGVCLSLDATPGTGGKNWAILSTSGNAGR